MSLPSHTAVDAVAHLSSFTCGKCGGVYAIAESYRLEKQEQGGFWVCPYCKCEWGYGDSQIAQLRREVESERKRREWALMAAKQAEYRRRAIKGKLTKIAKHSGNASDVED